MLHHFQVRGSQRKKVGFYLFTIAQISFLIELLYFSQTEIRKWFFDLLVIPIRSILVAVVSAEITGRELSFSQ